MGGTMPPNSGKVNGNLYDVNVISSYGNSTDCGLRNLSEFAYVNPLLAAFKSTLRKDSVPHSRRDLLIDDMVTGLLVSRIFMRSMEGVVSVTAEAPLERVKLLLQNQGESIKSGRLSRPYLGIKDCFSRTIRNEGVLSLWRGNSVRLISILPTEVFSLAFSVYFNEIAFKLRKDKQQEMYLEKWLTRTAALGCGHLCLYPLRYAHTRLCNDIKCCSGNGGRQFNNMFDVYRKTIKSDGVVGIYRGFSLHLILGQLFENLLPGKGNSEEESSQNSFAPEAMLAAAYLTSYPIDTVQTRMMMTSGEVLKYKSCTDAFMQIIKNEGILSLYKGSGASLLSMILSLCGVLVPQVAKRFHWNYICCDRYR